MVFSCFVNYEGYHEKGTLDFEQRMVKELLELLLRKYHTVVFLSWCKLYDQFHSVNGTKISHMKIWKRRKSLSARHS